MGIKAIYAVLLIKLANRAPDSLQRVRLSWLRDAQKVVWGASGLLLLDFMVDATIFLDFMYFEGRHSALLVGIVNLFTLPALGYACVMAGRELLLSDKLYADTELNLQRLARKAGVPARAVSRAINARTQQNMSQWVNKVRIDAACELLRSSDISIGQAMFEVGFSTKSNFNREFKRMTGQSPSEWRKAQHS